MKQPETVEDILRGEVIITAHAGFRFCERVKMPPQQNTLNVLFGVLGSGVLYGGQKGNQVSVLATVKGRNHATPIVFILERYWKAWLVKTVLTKAQADANMQNLNKRAMEQ